MELCSEEAVKYVWEGAIPLQIHLHESEVTTLPPPPPILVLGSRIGYLPLLVPLIKPHFSSTLPPGTDSVWFDYKGLPLKWYIPIGVLFDLLCAEPERPWNLTVHFRGHPGDVLTPCEGEDSVKWSYINSLKEAAYIINGNCKNIMNMSQADQFELWQSLVKGNMDDFLRISSRLKLGPLGEDCMVRSGSSLVQPRQAIGEPDFTGSGRPCRIPVRLYVRNISEDLDDLEDAVPIDCWDRISYINRPVEIHKEEGRLSLKCAMKTLLPEIFLEESLVNNHEFSREGETVGADSSYGDSETIGGLRNAQAEEIPFPGQAHVQLLKKSKIKMIRIQGIELDMDIPFFWVVNNLKNPEYFLHICVFMGTSSDQSTIR
ncbi:autophagy protein 5 isoform X1 [Phoenix dactylifera]|uniref:Autophagy protein 5 n=1 Tax=Phoenix dactylifera TaxID=42345 RepID=A0A8B7CRF5_PHODC|nr:autophagy protein 5 isoform X1 [Phoenix dactylifera]